MLLGCLKTLQRPYQILDWYWALAFLWQNNNIAKCADGRDGKPHSKGSKFLVSKCLYCFSPDWLEKPSHSSHFPKWYWKRHQKPFVRQMSCRSWEKVAVKIWLCSRFPKRDQSIPNLIFLNRSHLPPTLPRTSSGFATWIPDENSDGMRRFESLIVSLARPGVDS